MASRGKILLLLFVYIQLSQAQLLPPSFGNRTYVSNGSNVTLNWSYNFPAVDVAYVEWYFTRTGGTEEILADTFGGTFTKKKSSLPNNSPTLPSTLILSNVNINYNGTYKFVAIVRNVNPVPSSEVEVIILEQPTANVGCPRSTIVKEGLNFSCLCNSVGGNPPPFALWSKNGALVDGSGYLEKNLVLTNVSKGNSGTYICNVKSHTLEDERNITIIVNTKPRANVSCAQRYYELDEGERFSCTCSSIGGNPTPSASWSEGGKSVPINGLTPLSNVLSFPSITKSSNGTYTCKVQSLTLFDEVDIDLYVRYKPETPEVKANATSVVLGNAIEITCVSKGYPEPRYTLTFNNSKNEPLTILRNVIQVKYIIKNVTNSHNGSYVCTAFNDLGSSTGTLTVDVLSEATPVISPSPSTPSKSPSLSSTSSRNIPKSAPATSDDLSEGAIAGIAVGVLFLIIILILLVCYCRPSVCCCVLPCFNTEKSGERGNIVIDNNSATYNYTPGGVAENAYESPDGKTNDGASNSSSSRPSSGAPTSTQGAADMPPVYSVVDKSRIPKKAKEPEKEEDPNQLTYASLDPIALQPDSSRMHPREKPESNYAQIDLGKL